MIVWGGLGAGNTGARYNPTTDTWIPTAVSANTPSARRGHVAVWAEFEMVVWGGRVTDFNYQFFNTGGRYKPSSDSWNPTSIGANVPSARQDATGVWTGSEMIVWGGIFANAAGTTTLLNTGGRYDVTSNSWAPTSTSTSMPSARFNQTVVWTGSEMIVWGGDADSGTVNTGRRYCACPNGRIYYRDTDGDGYGDPGAAVPSCDGSIPAASVADSRDCDDANATVHARATEICNGIDDNCDAQIDEDASGLDSDGDGIQNACDNCVPVRNPNQTDFDLDGQGDACDLDDGLIYVMGTDDKNLVRWQQESGYTSWNCYRGSLAILRSSGQYTQAPGSNPLAARDCGLVDPYAFDPALPDPDEVAFSLVTGMAGGVESGLGTNGVGVTRANTDPCP